MKAATAKVFSVTDLELVTRVLKQAGATLPYSGRCVMENQGLAPDLMLFNTASGSTYCLAVDEVEGRTHDEVVALVVAVLTAKGKI